MTLKGLKIQINLGSEKKYNVPVRYTQEIIGTPIYLEMGLNSRMNLARLKPHFQIVQVISCTFLRRIRLDSTHPSFAVAMRGGVET
jgi:hypothetical protein